MYDGNGYGGQKVKGYDGDSYGGQKVKSYNGDFVDKTLKCIDCEQEFVFTAGEQSFYAEKGFKNEPRRCKLCREGRKREISKKTMYPATCASCHQPAEVPFEPSEGRPVYCSECFSKVREDQKSIQGSSVQYA